MLSLVGMEITFHCIEQVTFDRHNVLSGENSECSLQLLVSVCKKVVREVGGGGGQ